jgi:hypothetical protein
MARSDYVERVKDVLLGAGLGEKTAIRQCAADASVSVSGKIVTFDLASGECAKVKAGHTLSLLDSTDDTDAYSFYVLSVDTDTDTVTARNGYKGAPAISNASTDLNSQLLEQNAVADEYQIHKRIDTVFARFLWREAYMIDTATIATPNLSTYQDEVPTEVMKILEAGQIVSDEYYPIAFGLKRNVPSGVSSTGTLARFDYWDGSVCYYSYMRKLEIGDEAADESLVEMVALGAAALLMGADTAASNRETAKKDSQVRGRLNPANALWRDFITLRNQYSEELGEETAIGFNINRG